MQIKAETARGDGPLPGRPACEEPAAGPPDEYLRIDDYMTPEKRCKFCDHAPLSEQHIRTERHMQQALRLVLGRLPPRSGEDSERREFIAGQIVRFHNTFALGYLEGRQKRTGAKVETAAAGPLASPNISPVAAAAVPGPAPETT